jgi:hypothetical protein
MLHKDLPKLIAILAENGFERLRESNILQQNYQNEIQAVDQQQRRMQRPSNVGIPGEITTPAHTQRAAFAALHTAGSVSGLSSLGNSDTTSRSDCPIKENDSDNGDTDNEDNYEVDYFLQSRRELQSQIDGEYCDDMDKDVNSVMVQNEESVLDYGRHLEKCLDFNFVDESFRGLRQHIAYCNECGVYTHNSIRKNRRNIHTLFPGKSCMEILQSQMGKEIWNIQQTKQKRNSVKYNHPLIQELQMLNENFLSEV